jgi:hypothetical protein
MHTLRRLLLLSLLLSLPASAQELEPWASDDSLQEPLPERWSPAARIGAELGGGLLGMVGGGVAGFGVGLLAGLPLCDGESWYELCLGATGVLGSTVGGFVGLPLGIRWAGQAAGSTGSAWAAAGGATLGVGAVALAASTGREELVFPAVLSIPLLAVFGYELSDREPEEGSVTPSVALGPGGGTLALHGRF